MRLNKKTYSELNKILADWNPLEVPDYVAQEEYTGYIPVLSKNLCSLEDIESALLEILDALGLEHEDMNLRHTNDLKQVSYKIWDLKISQE